jgi:RHS repeat-associated protein
MSSATTSSGTTSYIYNALGQLIEKSNGAGSAYLVYDESGHILGEYSSSGALIQETIWMGDTPVATLQANGSGISIYYIHTDHLGTPRKITDPSTNTVVWRWDPDTFGSVVPSITTIPYNLRFPGQYYQAETGLMYNYFRDYDPQTGRYIESDPIGLYGGSWSTYSYTNNNPISNTDSTGQADFGGLTGGVTPIEAQGASAAANFAAWWNTPDACIQAYLQRYFPTVAAHPGFSLLSAMSGPQNMFPGGPDAYVQDSIVMGGLKGLLSRMGKFVDWPLRIFGAATIPYATTANIEAAAHCASTCDQK